MGLKFLHSTPIPIWNKEKAVYEEGPYALAVFEDESGHRITVAIDTDGKPLAIGV